MTRVRNNKIRILSNIQRITLCVFFVAIIAVFGGFILGIFFEVSWADNVLGGGWLVAGLLILHRCIFLPFLKCPNCGHRFFVAEGVAGFFTTLNVAKRSCIHCEFSLDSSDSPSQ
jgi:hypothetical protein